MIEMPVVNNTYLIVSNSDYYELYNCILIILMRLQDRLKILARKASSESHFYINRLPQGEL